MLAEPGTNSASERSPATPFPPPIVTYVCSPERLAFNWIPVTLLAIGVLAVGIMASFGNQPPWRVCSATGAFALIPGGMLLLARLTREHLHQIQRSTFLKRHPRWNDDPLAARLGAAWHARSRLPSEALLRRIIPRGDACRVICFGVPELPPFEPAAVEPMVITPTERTGLTPVRLVPIILVVFVIYALYTLKIVGLPIHPISVFSGVIGAVSLSLLLWIWHAGLRPFYIRVAPRMIQFIHYKPHSQTPIIRSYPADGSTIVYVEASGRMKFISPEHDDAWGGSSGTGNPPKLAIVLAALNAQRPTPPLSETELVG